MKPLILRRKITPERAKDIARMRKILEAHGYSADDGAIESAYAAWSAALPNHPEWHPLSYMADAKKLMEALLTQLEPEAAKEAKT